MRVVLKKLGLKRNKHSSSGSDDKTPLPEKAEDSHAAERRSDDQSSNLTATSSTPQVQPMEQANAGASESPTSQNEYGEHFTDEFQGPDTSSLKAFLVSLLSFTPEPPERLRSSSNPTSPRSPPAPHPSRNQSRKGVTNTSSDGAESSDAFGGVQTSSEYQRTSSENQALFSRVHETAVRAHEAVARAEETISTSRVRPDGPGVASQGGLFEPETNPPLDESSTTPADRAQEAAVRAKEIAARAGKGDFPTEEAEWQVVSESEVPPNQGFWQPSEIGARSHHHMPGKIKTISQLVIPSKVVPRSDIEPPKKSPPRKPPELSEPSVMLKEETRALLCTALPALAMGRQWVLLYSTERHGISLHTLYRNSANDASANLLVVQDSQGAIFGAFSSQPYNPSARRKYQGGNDCFVFSEKDGEPKLYRSTGDNRYFQLCTNDALAFGGGDHFALRLDEELLHGSSGPCETFGSPCLASSEEFDIRYVEVWGFAHVRRSSFPS